ncbi:MAG: hypothetical protein GY941_08165, partial [Planctomycetes bacterium]|nr:hypothetical protein [Planctomycetota bacterium]
MSIKKTDSLLSSLFSKDCQPCSIMAANILIFGVCALTTTISILSGYGPIHDTISWHGIVHLFNTSLEKGIIPFWNPYSQTGTPFFYYFQVWGVLDPVNLTLIIAQKLTGCSTYAIYVIRTMFWYFIFISGTYNLLRLLIKDNRISLYFSFVLFLSTFLVT